MRIYCRSARIVVHVGVASKFDALSCNKYEFNFRHGSRLPYRGIVTRSILTTQNVPTTAPQIPPQKPTRISGSRHHQNNLDQCHHLRQNCSSLPIYWPRGTGKTSTARILAKSLNCLNSKKPTATPCGECSSCKTIDSCSSLDVTEIDAASHNGVDDARELIQHSNFAPAMSSYRIWILDECHQLSTSAQNALLKCLEEPPAHVVFILCTTEAHKVLPTIISRCQTFNFRALSVDAIVGQLHKISSAESIAIASEAMRAIARTCDGGLRDALQLPSQLSLLNSEITLTQVAEVSGSISEQDSIALLKAIHSGDTLSVLQSSRTLIDSGKTPKLILSSLLAAMRDLLIVKSTRHCQNLIAGPVGYSQLRSLALHLDFETIDAACTQLQKSEFQLRTSTNAATWLEVCLLNLMLSSKPAAPETRLPATCSAASTLWG